MAKRSAFTLIELLVVIAIIAILAAILFPVFARAREKARQASCSSNCKQIALACLMYTQDYDEKLPSDRSGVAGTPTFTTYVGQVVPYIKNFQIFRCPSDGTNRVSVGINIGTGAPWGCPAGTNSPAWQSDGVTWLAGEGAPLALIPAPAETILNMCAGGYTAGTGGPPDNWWTYPQSLWFAEIASGCARNGFAAVHNGGTNYSFCDGHVKWLKPEATWSPKNLWTRYDAD
jgi:prepilin-type N-terminal cleavage/methylation domain-containing protein/prepilin-type processing-associated H-X9-DG protein